MHERPNACGGSPESGYDAEEEQPFTRLLGHLPCYLFYYPRSLPRQHSLRLFHKLIEETGDVEEPEECDEKDDECKEREEHLEGYCCRIGHHVVFDESLDRVDQVFMQLAKPDPMLSRLRIRPLLYPWAYALEGLAFLRTELRESPDHCSRVG